ncbi:MAG: M1 family aminopeptidase [Bryobacteraceae bacterium]
MDSVDEDFTAMLVYFSDSTFDEIEQHSELADEAPDRHEEAFKRVRNILERRREPGTLVALTPLERLLNYEDIANYEAEILAELYNPSQRGSFRAFLHGRKHSDLRFLLNPGGAMPMLAAPEETALLNFDPNSETDGIWYLSHMASELQSGRASSSEDKRLIAAEHYQIQVIVGLQNALGDQPDLGVTCDLRFRALDDGIRMVKFDLFPDLQVSRVAWNGKDIPFIQESRKHDGSFYLQMPEPLLKGHTYQVTFEYSGGEILQSKFGWAVPIPPRRVWYPTPAGPASRATYDITFHIPHGMTIVSVGNQIKQTRNGASDVSEWSSDVPISQAVFRYIDGVYSKTSTDETTHMELSAYVGGGGRVFMPESVHDILIDTSNSMRVYNDWFGAPAYKHVSVVVGPGTDSLPGLVYAWPFITAGYSSLVAQSMVISGGNSSGPPPRIKTFLDEAFSRELSRQWWGNTVGSVSFHDAWLSSGFANFSTSLYDLAAYMKPDEFRDHWVRAREFLLAPNRFGVRPNDAGPVWMGVLNDTFRTPAAGNLLSMLKGGYIVHMLRSMMWDAKTGDASFRSMMQDYVKHFTNQAVSTEDFKWLVEKHMKPDMDLDGNHRMDWFFGDWVYGTDVPSYRFEYSLAAENGGKRVLTGKLTQSGVSQGFKMLVPVFAEFATEKVRICPVAIRGNTTADFKIALPEAPKRVLLNLNHDVLADKEEVKLVK